MRIADTSGKLDYPWRNSTGVAKLDKRFSNICPPIGDRGIRTALDAYEYARKVNGRDSRHEMCTRMLTSRHPRFKGSASRHACNAALCPDITAVAKR